VVVDQEFHEEELNVILDFEQVVILVNDFNNVDDQLFEGKLEAIGVGAACLDDPFRGVREEALPEFELVLVLSRQEHLVVCVLFALGQQVHKQLLQEMLQ
jgi:hypothetical protein